MIAAGTARGGDEGRSVSPRSCVTRWVVIALWLCVVVLCFAKLAVYAQTPGFVGAPPNAAATVIPIDRERHTLVLCVHPKCPCTQATIYELERLLRRCDELPMVVVYIYESEESPETWYEHAAASIQTRIPDALIMRDPDGEVSESIRVYTSGSTVLYERDGSPVFWGGSHRAVDTPVTISDPTLFLRF